jgi:hypothetical protein
MQLPREDIDALIQVREELTAGPTATLTQNGGVLSAASELALTT